MERAHRQPFPRAEAGAFLITLTLASIGVGALIGWLAGATADGILAGAIAGVPIGVYAVYRRYRGYFT